MTLKDTFLFRLYKADRILFVLLMVYTIGGILFCAKMSSEEFPVLLYGMYSLKEHGSETYTTYSISVDGKPINDAKLWDAERELMTSPLINYASSFADSSSEGRSNTHDFESWLWHYVVNQKSSAASEIEVYKYTCAYNKTGDVRILKKELLFTYAEQ